ncbi:MAG TPA: serine/threonine-protein kinase [Anaeromyxobacteraceae bacterium]|nr:serine/threonine-protein kinase [Anaeromyxobacteraceae bacterium]
MPPRTIGAWELTAVIGRGGIGTVYRAQHRATGQPAAVKLLGPPPAVDPNAARRLAREYEALRDLDHPNVVRVFEAGVCEGYGYLAMELVEGLDLRSYLSLDLDLPGGDAVPWSEGTPSDGGAGAFGLEAWSGEPATDEHASGGGRATLLSGPDAIRAFAEVLEEPETDESSGEFCSRAREADPWESGPDDVPPVPPRLVERLNRPARMNRLAESLRQVCDALVYVHARGLVHRDLKPSNIMVDDERRVRLMDFGLVRSKDEGAGSGVSRRVVGTYRYMAPEQARGLPVDARADLYSLGVILYELLCGRPPFLTQPPGELAREILTRRPPPVASLNPGADPRLAAMAERLLRKDPAERFQSAAEVLQAVRAAERAAQAPGAGPDR